MYCIINSIFHPPPIPSGCLRSPLSTHHSQAITVGLVVLPEYIIFFIMRISIEPNRRTELYRMLHRLLEERIHSVEFQLGNALIIRCRTNYLEHVWVSRVEERVHLGPCSLFLFLLQVLACTSSTRREDHTQ